VRFGLKGLSGRLVCVDVQHEIYGLDGKFGLAAQQKIDQFLKVISRFGRLNNSRHEP
jgi:hypothetical protein